MPGQELGGWAVLLVPGTVMTPPRVFQCRWEKCSDTRFYFAGRATEFPLIQCGTRRERGVRDEPNVSGLRS